MLLAALAIFFAFFVQSLAGFGTGLIAMPVLVSLFGVSKAAPLFLILAQLGLTMMLIRYRTAFSWSAVWRLIIAGAIAIPIGVWGAQLLDERLVTVLLGIFTAGYGVYGLVGMSVPPLENQRWAYVFGGFFGLLAGAYNVGGPPLVIYGTSQDWKAKAFKSNISTLFFIGGIIAILSHWGAGNLTSDVLETALLFIPIMIVGKLSGFAVEHYVNQQQFRRGVLVLLVILGLVLIF